MFLLPPISEELGLGRPRGEGLVQCLVDATSLEQADRLANAVVVKDCPAGRLGDDSLLPQRPDGGGGEVSVGLDILQPDGHDKLEIVSVVSSPQSTEPL